MSRRTAEPNLRDITKLALEEARKMERQLLDVRRKSLDQCVARDGGMKAQLCRYDGQIDQIQAMCADDKESTKHAQLIASVQARSLHTPVPRDVCQARFRKNMAEINHELLLNAQHQERWVAAVTGRQ